MRRKQFMVAAPGGEMSVFADDFTVTPSGNAVFAQVRDERIMNQDGSVTMGKDMVTVLVLVAGSYNSIRMVNESGHDLYKESGEIQMVQ